MFTLSLAHSCIARVFHDRWGAEGIGDSPSESQEMHNDTHLIETFRNLFKDSDFVAKVQDKIHAIKDTEQQVKLLKALTEVMNINKSVELIHQKVRGQLFSLLGDVEKTA